MLKHKKFYSLLFLPLFALTSCQSPKSVYTIYQAGNENNHLTITKPEKWSEVIEIDKDPYDLTNDLTNLVVTYNGEQVKTWVPDLKTAQATNDNYFICVNDTNPTNGIVADIKIPKPDIENSDFAFYIGHLEYVDESAKTTVHMSDKIVLKIHSKGGLIPWLVPVISISIVLIAMGMIFFTKKYKEKHP